MPRRGSRLDRSFRRLERLILSPLMAVAAYLVERALRRLLARQATGSEQDGDASRTQQAHR